MDIIKQHYIIDLSSSNNFVQVVGMQGDGNGVRYIEVELNDNGQAYVLDSNEVDVSIIGTKPDTKQIWNLCEVTNEGYILVELTHQILAVEGIGYYCIMITKKNENTQLKSFPFIVLTEAAPYDPTYIESSDEFQRITALIDEIKSATSYSQLQDKPSINGVTLSGNKTSAQLNIQDKLTFDNAPLPNSNNSVKSGGIYASLHTVDNKIGTLTNLSTSIKTDIVSAINSLVGTKATSIVSGNSVTFNNSTISSSSIIDGVYVDGIIANVVSVSFVGTTITFTFADESANGKNAIIWIKN